MRPARRRPAVTPVIVALLLASASATPARAQTPAAAVNPPGKPVVFVVRDWTRVESWRYFEPNPGGGNPDYTDIANRLQFGVERRTRKYEVVLAMQYVQFGGLPANATGPGPLGTGSLYFDQGGRTASSRQLYLRYLNLKLNDLVPGWSLRLGRMAYTSGAESPSGDPAIETIKRQRVDSRLLGEFEWALYQRGFDGVRTDFDRGGWHLTGAFMRPTQGGFEDEAGVEISDINVWAVTVSARPGRLLPHTDWQAFAIGYDDEREVTQRPDNSGRTTSRVDVNISTFGSTLVGAYPSSGGRRFDTVLWGAAQTGDWFGQTHRATAFTVEGGLQWTAAPGKPWVRGGYSLASGDGDAGDATHGTFFHVLPTSRKYALSATYSFMNLEDAFVQFLATPVTPLSLRVDVHRLGLARAADRWYFGSGAGQKSGAIFGYGSRASQGATDFGTVIEGAADYRVNPHWSVNGYLGTIRGGEVVTRTFHGRTLVFGYVENVLVF